MCRQHRFENVFKELAGQRVPLFKHSRLMSSVKLFEDFSDGATALRISQQQPPLQFVALNVIILSQARNQLSRFFLRYRNGCEREVQVVPLQQVAARITRFIAEDSCWTHEVLKRV